ncbi:MAG TPA: hypothetical protein VGM20_08365 [Gemmatimonadales bacterium]|jgi:hypothetical protein
MGGRFALLLGIVVVAGCDANQLAPATIVNQADTVTMGALTGAALRFPSAFDVTVGEPVRTDQTSSFDFIYDIDSTGRHLFIPLHALPDLGSATGVNPGFLRETGSFDQLTNAPSDPYQTTDSLVIAPGDLFYVRSRIACYLSVPQYAKIQVIDFDDVAKTVRLEVMADINCGYKNLQPGIPAN